MSTKITKWEDIKEDMFLDDEEEEEDDGDDGFDDEDSEGSKMGVMPEDDESLRVPEKSTFIDEVKRYLSVSKVKRAFSLGSELFGAATPFLDKPTWWNAGRAAFNMGKVLVEDVEVYSEDYFAGDEWIEPYSQDFNQTLLHVLQKFPYERIKAAEENTFIRITTLPNGVKVGWTYAGRLQMVDHIYVETEKEELAKEFIKKLLWEQFEGKSLVMRKNTRMAVNTDEARVIFEEDDAFESKHSKRAVDYATYLKKPLDAGVPRSVMFYGPPGTGKSTLARTIVELMGLRSFRIRIGDLGQLDNSTLFEAINIFQPDAVILDDFDRTHHQAELLETLEYFQERVKLVMVTVNNKRKLDDALLRPGRIDELILIDKMDEEVVKHCLGQYADGFPLVKDWPIAFINEYVVRRTYLTSEEAAESVKELTKRVQSLSKYRDEDDEGMARMFQQLEKAKRKGRVRKTDAPPPAEEDELNPDMLKDLELEVVDLDDEDDDEVDADDDAPFPPSDDEDSN
jgi:adenylate kinase family enzyme